MGSMEVFYITISILFLALLLAALVFGAIDGHIDAARKKIIDGKIAAGNGNRVEENKDFYLKVSDGTIELCQDAQIAAEPIAEEVAEPAAAAEVAAADDSEAKAQLQELVDKYGEITDNSVVFESNKAEKETFADKYNNLDEQTRARYDEITEYILAKEDCKKSEAANAVTFKCKTDKIVKVNIKRGVVVLNFLLMNRDLNRFVREENVKTIKINPVVIKLEDDADLALAKQTADITVETIREEQQYRKEKLREARRARYRQKEESAE